MIILSKITEKTQNISNIDNTPLRLPRRAWLLKFTFALWNLCSVIINCYFTTTLTSTLAFPDQDHQINGMADIYASNLRIAINPVYVFVYI